MTYISGGNELLDQAKIFDRLGIKIGSKVADLGCGSAGHFVIPAAQKVGNHRIVYAVDILKSVLQSVVTKGRLEGVNNIKTVWSNLEIVGATKIKEESLDFALLINILFQSKKHENIIKEAVRLLKPEGKLLVIDWDLGSTNFGPPQEMRLKPEVIKKMAAGLNLKLLDEFQAGTYHYGLIFSK